MNFPKQYIIVCLFTLMVLLFVKTTFAQLSGTYTLGGGSSDYPTFADAINDIKDQGLSGDVEFLVKPGAYHFVSIVNIENDSNFNIRFAYDQSENDSAVINGQLKVVNSDYISFEGFSIYPEMNQDFSCVMVDESNSFSLENCKILNIYNNEFDDDEGLISFDFPWEGLYYRVYITNCMISSADETIVFNGKMGRVYIRESIITGYIHDRYGYIKKNYYDNIFYCTDRDYQSTGQLFVNNTFYFESIFHLQAKGEFIQNTFFTDVEISSGKVIGNTFYDYVEMKWCNNASVTGNVFYSNFRTIFSNGIMIRNNIFYDSISFNNDNTCFANNIVFDTVSFSHGPGQRIMNNNFRKNSYLKLFWTGGLIRNNNLGNLYIVSPQISQWRVEDNNFLNQGNGNVCCYGERAHFYNPMYDTLLRANNPLLTGKGGKYYYNQKYDIDSVFRKDPCTIGANEICFDWQADEVDLSCSDSIRLDLCIDTLENAYWSPGRLFADSVSANPVIYPEDSVTVYLKRLDETIVDSMHINVQPSMPVAFATYVTEGLTVSFENQSECAKNYLWEFGDGVLSNEKSPVHEYSADGSYECKLTASNSLGQDDFILDFEVVSVEENKNPGWTVSVFPNPAKDRIHIECPGFKTGSGTIEIISLEGITLMKKQIAKGNEKIDVKVKGLQTGMYLCKITLDKRTFSKRIIIE